MCCGCLMGHHPLSRTKERELNTTTVMIERDRGTCIGSAREEGKSVCAFVYFLKSFTQSQHLHLFIHIITQLQHFQIFESYIITINITRHVLCADSHD